jgi:hypothetical protein
MEVRAQADAWVTSTAASNGSGNWTNMSGTGIPTTTGLPAPGGQTGYSGAAAIRSQHVRTNGDGQLIFFEVDGRLYDGDGYLIADARGAGCEECLEPGVMEFVSVPVPGSCGLYYLFSAVPQSSTYNASHVQVSLLDMNADNTRFAPDLNGCNARKGRLIDLGGSLPAQFSAWTQFGFEPIAPTSDRVGRLITGTTGKSISPIIRVVAGAQASDPSWLYFIVPDRIYVFKVTSNGVFPVAQPVPGSGADHVTTYVVNTPYVHKQYFRDADAVRLVNGEIRLALVDGFNLYVPPFNGPSYNLLTMRFNGATGQVIAGSPTGYAIEQPPAGCNGGPTTQIPGGLRGCALTADGNGLYLTGERTPDCQTWSPFIKHLDLNTSTQTDLTSLFANPIQLVRSRIYRNRAPSGTGDAIYFPLSTGIGAFTVTAVPANGVYTANALSGSAPLWVPVEDPSVNIFKPRFLNTSISGDQHLSIASKEACCSYFQTVPGAMVGGHIQLAGMQPSSWSAGSNPLQPGTSTLVFNCDLVVKPGANLYLNNLTLKFANGAKIIVERGGSLFLTNCTATSVTCPGERWPGIRVEGTTSSGTQLAPFQGRLSLMNSTVENAVVGAWTTRETAPGVVVPGYTGGRITGNNSTFKNCISGVRIDPYVRTSSTGAVLNNLCRFDYCTFITDAAWPDLGVNNPLHHARLLSVRGVKFIQCKFRNDAPSQFAQLNRGWGIQGAAGFDVLGSSTADASLFSGLTIGVYAATQTIYKANIRSSWFRDNFIGAYILASTAPEVSRSHFFVPTGIWPNPAMGLLLHQSTGYVVEENAFAGMPGSNGNVGIYWRGNVPHDNRIYNNTFNHLFVGTYVKDRHWSTNKTGLQILCGDYTSCVFDYYLGDNTRIREEQGTYNENLPANNQLAGNRFYSGLINGIVINNTQPQGANAPYFFYKRHNVPECDPINPSQFYVDDEIIDETEFNKAQACGDGRLQTIGGGGGVVGFILAAAQLQSAQANLNGTVDTGEREGILEAIKRNDPWLPSHTLRDYLLARCPLSDEVLLTMLYREVPMDPWHLTQVLLANAKLTEQVKKVLEASDLLNPYMLSIVLNAGSGPTVKDLLVQEVVLRGDEKARYLAIALDEWATDTITPDPADSLRAMLAAHPDPNDYYLLAELEMERGDHTAANGWLDALVAAKADDPVLLRDLVAMHQVLGGEWQQADAVQRASLATMAGSTEPGAAMAWAILYQLNETNDVPTAEEPSMEKSLSLTPARRTTATERPALEAHPNPSHGQSWAVITVELEDGALLRISDPQGRLVRTLRLAAGQRLVELDLMSLANGLYTCELLQGEYKLGVTKLNVQR